MKYSELKAIREFCEGLFSTPDWKEVIRNIGADDFTVDNVRFIKADEIDNIQVDEMQSNSYMLGCFSAHAIAHATDWPVALIEAAQKGEAYEEIGDAMSREQIESLQEYYVSYDGYGNHFNSYDGCEEEARMDGIDYYVFDNR